MFFDIPAYQEPYEYEEPDESWERGLTGYVEIECTNRENISVYFSNSERVAITVNNNERNSYSPDDNRIYWTVVHFLRDFGVPGVAKERVDIDDTYARLGALYCIAIERGAMQFLDRETDYSQWGENPVSTARELEWEK